MSALDGIARFPLLEGTTPVQRLSRLEARAGDLLGGARLYAKRDDLMGLGGGGNKLRKLEYLLADAQARGCDTFITTGGLQSNHARQSAAAAARAGLACELMLADVVPRHDAAYRGNGNLLLDDLFGATVHRLPVGADPLAAAQARAQELAAEGRRPYVVGNGGSSPLGCLGYARCAAEILQQEEEAGLRFEAIVVANGSSGTHAGLAAGLAAAGDDPARVLSFTVLAPLDEALAETRRLAAAALQLLAPDRCLGADDIRVDGSQRGEAYGAPTAAMVDALRLLARTEGLLLDPVYSGKAFAGLLDRAKSGGWRDKAVLFVMTGGTPGLFAYPDALSGN
ncbi:D-cysteine desulfhydrase family protein [Sphingomonas aracearum]|uniref:D-cysteine desulfhydrase family protein n=1 Tax=Sphingomonas aracearum TaxID=2283317 RepID=A0A369VUJ5_9SPHN|nr:D-cysteine desulfhydrase family protein [Sphingomonas aracearum]RDE05325.1 D-cysteine desulfhydrase family protein [Sphingomonas aracearum]